MHHDIKLKIRYDEFYSVFPIPRNNFLSKFLECDSAMFRDDRRVGRNGKAFIVDQVYMSNHVQFQP